MNKTRQMMIGKSGVVLCAALTAALTGCVGYVEPRGGRGTYVEAPPPVYVERQVVVQPEYVYYPDYQVYYSSHTRQYVYRDGRSWVSRPAPPRVSIDVLFASPFSEVGPRRIMTRRLPGSIRNIGRRPVIIASATRAPADVTKTKTERCRSGPGQARMALINKIKSRSAYLHFGFFERTGGNLLSRKLYNHYHRQDCV